MSLTLKCCKYFLFKHVLLCADLLFKKSIHKKVFAFLLFVLLLLLQINRMVVFLIPLRIAILYLFF